VDGALICRRISPNAARSYPVQHQGRGGVEIAHNHAVLVSKSLAKQDAGHFDTVFRPLRCSDRAQKGAVRIFDMGINHIKVALVDGHVGWLANGAARVVQPRAGLRQFHKITKILNGAIAAALVDIHHKGGAVGGGKHHRIAADLNGVFGVAGMLDKAGGGGFEQIANHAVRAFDIPAICREVSDLRARRTKSATAAGSSRNSMPISAMIRSAVVSIWHRLSSPSRS